MYLFFLLVFYAKKVLQCVEENSKEPDARKLVLVPYGNGMRELGDLFGPPYNCFSNLSFIL
jgi:hypothetical protein